MKIRNIVLTICILAIISMPIKVQANEMKTNAIGGSTVISDQQIEMLEPEEAERIHRGALNNSEIVPMSNLATSTIRVSEGDNILYVTYSTRSRTIADKIGVRNVTFQEKTGLFWKTLSINSGYSENTDTYFGGFSMTNPVNGAQYRAECTHYTIIDGQETSSYNETLPYTYTK